MAIPVIETAIGVIDSVNKIFSTSLDYTPGTTRVFLNGQLKDPNLDDGHTELGNKQIQLNEAPLMDFDEIQIRYITLI